jgi:hypothetical protein
MSKEHPTTEVTPIGNGIYRLFSVFDKESIALTAQALLELSIWITENTEMLEADAQQEQHYQPYVSSS